MGRKSIINAKINELKSLKETLQMVEIMFFESFISSISEFFSGLSLLKVKEQNHDSALKLKALKDGIETSDSIAETDAAMVKVISFLRLNNSGISQCLGFCIL